MTWYGIDTPVKVFNMMYHSHKANRVQVGHIFGIIIVVVKWSIKISPIAYEI